MNEEALNPTLEFAIICDRAQVLAGKLYLMGGCIDTFSPPAFPGVINFSVAVSIEVPWHATNRDHEIKLSFQDADGVELGQTGLNFKTGRPPLIEPGSTQRFVFAIPSMGMKIEVPGGYVMAVQLNTVETKRVAFKVSAAPA